MALNKNDLDIQAIQNSICAINKELEKNENEITYVERKVLEVKVNMLETELKEHLKLDKNNYE